VKWPCFYGIDFASRAELIASGLAVEEICSSIGADTLAYISLGELVGATTIDADRLCRACFDGTYPIDLPAPELIGKHLLEGISRAVGTGAASADPSPDSELEQFLPGVGATDALQRP
jgi:amidophosphoribosyltransferase